jgi:hypothetical protein
MSYAQYKVSCPKCNLDSYLISIESNPIIFRCYGCMDFVVVANSRAYVIRSDFMEEMVEKYNFKFCGQVMKVEERRNKPSIKKKKTEITEEDIKSLHEFLEKSKDSSEFLKRL